jgi:hypothetical protein
MPRCRRDLHRQDPHGPSLADILPAPVRRWRQHRDPLPPQRSLSRELAPLLPSGIGVQREDQLADPVPASALHAENRDDAWHARGQQRQRVKDAFADPQRPGRRPAA